MDQKGYTLREILIEARTKKPHKLSGFEREAFVGERGCGRESSLRICLGGEGSRARKWFVREERRKRRERGGEKREEGYTGGCEWSRRAQTA